MGLSHWSDAGDARGVVLSVPAGDTVHLVRTYHVHACPNTGPYDYKPTQYMACRAEGGVIDRVYDLDPSKVHLFLLNPARISIERNRIIEQQPLDDATKNRVRNYVDRRLGEGVFEDPHGCDYRVYVFPTTGNIDLPSKPKLKGRAQNQRYIYLSALRRARDTVEPIPGY